MKFVDGKKIHEDIDQLTPGQVEIKFPQWCVRTLQSWRTVYEDSEGYERIGPKWQVCGPKIRRYRFDDLMRAANNLEWTKPYPPLMRDKLTFKRKKPSLHLTTSAPTLKSNPNIQKLSKAT